MRHPPDARQRPASRGPPGSTHGPGRRRNDPKAATAGPVGPGVRGTGQAVRLTEDQVREKDAIALAALDAIEAIGDDAEQRDTLEYLMGIVDDDRLSDRQRFGS
jgi:hypothetical protein